MCYPERRANNQKKLCGGRKKSISTLVIMMATPDINKAASQGKEITIKTEKNNKKCLAGKDNNQFRCGVSRK